MVISEAEFDAATQSGNAVGEGFSAVVKARFDRRTGRVVLALASGLQIAFLPRDTQGLTQARPEDLAVIEISPSGLGLHFPALDADVYVPSLLQGFLGSRRWMAQRHGRLGGLTASLAKSDAARQNGRLGGRPRKAT